MGPPMSSVVVFLLAVTLTFGAIAVAFGPSRRRAAAARGLRSGEGAAEGAVEDAAPAGAARRSHARSQTADTPQTGAQARTDARTQTDGPARTAARAQIDAPLQRDDVVARLHILALGGVPGDEPLSSKHAGVEQSIAKRIGKYATNPRYAPRRPRLLPELLRAVNDDETTRRELAAIIARDPALVGNLLKLANSAFYRISEQPVESVERAVAVLGTEGIRSLVAAAVMQPVLRKAGGKTGDFIETIWEQTYRSAAAAEAHAAFVEKTDRFAGQLLGLLMGLGTIVVYRASLDRFAARKLAADPTVVARAIKAHAPEAARRVAESWGLSERFVEAIDDAGCERADIDISALGRSLRFGLSIGALAVLRTMSQIDDDEAADIIRATGAPAEHAQRIWSRIKV